MRTTLVLVLVLAANGAATARAAAPTPATAKKRIERADQLPVHTYAVPNSVSKVLADEKLTAKLAAAVRRDLEGDLGAFDIQDAATLREYHGALSRIALLDGRLDDAIAHADRVRDLEDKPAVRIISGFVFRAAVAAKRAAPAERKATFDATVRKQLASFPYEQVQSELKSAKASLEMQSRNLVMGIVEEQLDPAAKGGTVSKDIAVAVVQMAATMRDILPYKEGAVAALQEVIDAHKVEKPDIWAARDVAFGADVKLTPVVVAIWDTGLDTSIFDHRLWVNAKEIPGNGKDDDGNGWVDDVNGIGFTWTGQRDTRALQQVPFSPAQLDEASRNMKGFSEMRAGLDTPDSAAVKKKLASLPKDEVKPFIESLSFYGNYGHGTHVGGITSAGNPAVRLLYSRMDWPWRLIPPRPDEAWARGFAAAMKENVAYFRKAGVRVVNMSWGLSIKEIEGMLELSGAPGTAEEHRKQAQGWFEQIDTAFRDAIVSAPEILFVAAAGNENSDSRFERSIPASYDLPNTASAGAVDRAGDEAAFTSYGKVDVYSNGYEVESVVPGGGKQRWSGTSMASPQVANLAAKLLARHPQLTTVQVKKAIVDGADEKKIGQRTIRLMNPKRSMELAAGYAPAS